MKKVYSYDPHRFQSILEQHRIRQVDVQRALGYTNSLMIKSWREGKDMYAERVCQICNAFGIDIHEFFVPVEEEKKEDTYRTDFEERLEETKKMKEEQLTEKEENMGPSCSCSAEANSGVDISFFLDRIDEAREKERDRQEKERAEEKKRFEETLNSCRERFDQALVEKNKEIVAEQQRANEIRLKNKELEMKLELLTRQYQELEIATYKGGSTSGIAENGQYLRK